MEVDAQAPEADAEKTEADVQVTEADAEAEDRRVRFRRAVVNLVDQV